MHVVFIHIFLPQFITDGLLDVLLFEVCHLSISLGVLNAHVWDDSWNLWVA